MCEGIGDLWSYCIAKTIPLGTISFLDINIGVVDRVAKKSVVSKDSWITHKKMRLNET